MISNPYKLDVIEARRDVLTMMSEFLSRAEQLPLESEIRRAYMETIMQLGTVSKEYKKILDVGAPMPSHLVSHYKLKKILS